MSTRNIVDQGEKLSLKETLTLLDGAARHNVQILITDSGQRTGTGSALMAMKDAGVNTYRWQGGEQRPATIISEADRNVRYARLAGDFAASVKAGEESVAQVSGVREQVILTQAIRSELKTQGVLGHCRAADAGGQSPAVPGGRQNGTSGAGRLPAGCYSVA